jgi:hypothetical protein
MDIPTLLALIQAEYREMPGLSLTKRQAQRLWGLDQATCDVLLEALEAARVVRRTAMNEYVSESA